MPEIFEFISQRFLIVLTQLLVPMVAYPYFALIVVVIFGEKRTSKLLCVCDTGLVITQKFSSITLSWENYD